MVKQFNKETVDLHPGHANHFVMFLCMYSTMFCSWTKWRLRDPSFLVQLSLHVCGSCLWSILIKFIHVETKQKWISLHYYHKQCLRSSNGLYSKCMGINQHFSHFYVIFKHSKLIWQSFIYNASVIHTITCLNFCKEPARCAIITSLCIL